METHLKTIHEEQYSDGTRVLGVLSNYSDDGWKDSLVYIFRNKEGESGTYIFFNTLVDMFDFMLYGEDKMSRAYMEEEEFDLYYDAPYIDGTFTGKLKWIS